MAPLPEWRHRKELEILLDSFLVEARAEMPACRFDLHPAEVEEIELKVVFGKVDGENRIPEKMAKEHFQRPNFLLRLFPLLFLGPGRADIRMHVISMSADKSIFKATTSNVHSNINGMT